jgi:hypothetical protein
MDSLLKYILIVFLFILQSRKKILFKIFYVDTRVNNKMNNLKSK